jgi:hypothetical protein
MLIRCAWCDSFRIGGEWLHLEAITRVSSGSPHDCDGTPRMGSARAAWSRSLTSHGGAAARTWLRLPEAARSRRKPSRSLPLPRVRLAGLVVDQLPPLTGRVSMPLCRRSVTGVVVHPSRRLMRVDASLPRNRQAHRSLANRSSARRRRSSASATRSAASSSPDGRPRS